MLYFQGIPSIFEKEVLGPDQVADPIKIGSDIEDSQNVPSETPVHFFFIQSAHCSPICSSKHSHVKFHPQIMALLDAAFPDDPHANPALWLSQKHTPSGQQVLQVSKSSYFFEDSLARFRIKADVDGKEKTFTIIGNPFQLSVLLWLKENNGQIQASEIAEKMNLYDDSSLICSVGDIFESLCSKTLHFPPICKYFSKKIKKKTQTNKNILLFNQNFFKSENSVDVCTLKIIPKTSFINQQILSQFEVIRQKKISNLKALILQTLKNHRTIGADELIQTIQSTCEESITSEEFQSAYDELTKESCITVTLRDGEQILEYHADD